MRENLEVCWHLSPPWRDRVPPLYFRIKECVYMPQINSIGWVRGAAWNNIEFDWTYSVCTEARYYRKQQSELRSCNRLKLVEIPPLKADLGEIVLVRGLGRRIVQGILLNGDRSWLYAIERNIPTLDPQVGSPMAWYSNEGILSLEAML